MSNGYHGPMGFMGLTPVVKNLLIINGLFFLATYAFLNVSRGSFDLTRYLALYYPASDHFRTWQLVSYMFMHGGFTHILFNMFALWMFGNILEQVWGPKRFLTYYMVTGIGAGIIHLLALYYEFRILDGRIADFMLNPNPGDFDVLVSKSFKGIFNPQWLQQFVALWSTMPGDSGMAQQAFEALGRLTGTMMDIPTVGASGAVFGILLAYGMLFPNSVIYLYFFFPIKAKWFVIIYGGLELYLGLSGRGGSIAHFAHLGGMIFGYLLIRHWKNKF